MKLNPPIHAPARRLLFASIALAALALAGCHSSMPPPTPLNQLNPQQMRGRQVFVQYCASCHHADSTKNLHGPGLEGLFHRKYMLSGMPTTNQHVISEIQYGRHMMPPFGNVLNDQQIQDLVAYLHTL